MSTWVVVTIIVIVLAFIISTITALLTSKPFQFSEEFKEAQRQKLDNKDDDDSAGLI
jgi:hypothetical protein